MDNLKVERKTLFSYPLFVFNDINIPNISDHIQMFYDLRKDIPVASVRSNIGGWQSYFDIHTYPIMTTLVRMIQEASISTFGVSCMIKDSWVNISGNQHSNAIHTHGGPTTPFPKHFSGVFYYKVPNNDSPIWFYDPADINVRVHHNPKPNQIILFPSHLAHSVDVNTTNEDRVSIAFNAENYLRPPK